MNNKIQIGLIGAGMIGDVHIDRIRKDGRGEVTWIASRTEETLQKKLKDFAIPNGTIDYREMLQDSNLDAIIIASPPFTHLQMVEDCLKAGKHVLLEKPMVISQEELQKLLQIVHDYPEQIVLECSCRHTRLQPKYKFIKEIIDSGELGEVYHIHHRSLSRGTFIEYNSSGAWAHQKKLAGGGPFMDWGVYDLSFHLGLLNDVPQIQSIQSFTRNGLKKYSAPDFKSDIEEHGSAWMNFDTGLTYYYERGSGVPCEAPNQTRIHGTKGSLRFAFCSWESPEIEYYHTDCGIEKYDILTVSMPEEHDDNQALATHFLDVLNETAKPEMTTQLAAKHLDILFRILNIPAT